MPSSKGWMALAPYGPTKCRACQSLRFIQEIGDEDLVGWAIGEFRFLLKPSLAWCTKMLQNVHICAKCSTECWKMWRFVRASLRRRSCDVVWNQILVRSSYQVTPLCAQVFDSK